MSVSKFEKLPFNCYELGHTWSPHCSLAAGIVGYHCFVESVKIYTTGYLISRLVTKRIFRSFKDVRSFIEDVVRSSLFLAMNGFGYVVTFCWLRKILGGFNYFTAGFIPDVVGCYAAILIEKPSRRPLLALYVTNVASETIFRMLRARGIVRDIKNFDLYLFTLSAATILYRMKRGSRRSDIIDSIFTKILGGEEFPVVNSNKLVDSLSQSQSSPKKCDSFDLSPSPKVNLALLGDEKLRVDESKRRRTLIEYTQILKFCIQNFSGKLERMAHGLRRGERHRHCSHQKSCFDYWFMGFSTRFVSGFGMQAAFQLALEVKKFVQTAPAKRAENLNLGAISKILQTCFKSGMGLSAMCLSFRFLNCCTRWFDLINNRVADMIPGLVSSALGFYLLGPPSTLALYLFFKAGEAIISQSHKENNWKVIRWFDSVYGGGWCLLYAVSTAFLLHNSVLEPQNLKPSYAKYLFRVTGGNLQLFNRHLLSVYGTKSNHSFMDFWPNYDVKYLSENMKKLIRMREEAGEGNKFIKDIVMQFVSH